MDDMEGVCRCGCGTPTERYRHTDPRRGQVKGEFKPWVKGHDKRKYHAPEGFAGCYRCKIVKPVSEFSKNKARPNGLNAVCKACHKAYSDTPENKERARATHLAWKAKDPDAYKSRKLRENYGIGIAEYDALLAAQEGCCAICGATETHNGKYLAVDHDHVTGQIRGLLCAACNKAIGLLQDRPERAAAAAVYVWRRGVSGGSRRTRLGRALSSYEPHVSLGGTWPPS